MDTVEYVVPSGKERLACSVDYSAGRQKPSVISISGLGPSNRRTTSYLAPVFHELGQSFIRFDHSGQGDSSGDLGKSSLEKRFSETKAVLEYFSLTEVATVVGTSIGGYIASLLANEFPVRNLVLFYPAAYSVRAWGLPFDSGFSDVIRAPDSFLESDVASSLEHFKGNALLIFGAMDEIIPEAVTDMYVRGLANCRRLTTLRLDGCPHPVHRWLETRDAERAEIQTAITRFLTKE
jgi:pimeloyl-ACP methyl ester carboxylesterase